MPSPPQTQAPNRYYVRRRGGTTSGPYDSAIITTMLAEGELDGSEQVSTDRQTWQAIATLGSSQRAVRDPNASQSIFDLEGDDGISLAPLEIGLGEIGGLSAAPAAGPSRGAPGGLEDDGVAIGPAGMEADLGAPLELVERKPLGKLAQLARPIARGDDELGAGDASGEGGGGDSGALASGLSPRPPAAPGAPAPVGSEASAAVASLLSDETEPVLEATRPIRLDDPPPVTETRSRPRTMTAARRGHDGPGSTRSWLFSKRTIVIAAALLICAAGAGTAVMLELPERLRGEPAPEKTLGPLAAELARDRFPAFAEGARVLEQSVAERKRAPTTRAMAAELLASSVVLHGAERARVSRAESLLEQGPETKNPEASRARLRAQGWIALAKGRWKDADRIAAEPSLSQGDRAVLSGWAAHGREQAPRAVELFTSAVAAQPAAAPSRVATLFAVARARESDLSPAAETAYRAVLVEAPEHVGSALGLARLSRLPPVGRLQLAETVIAKQSRDASRAELAEAHALVARASRELGDGAKAEAALKRARAADPASVAAAVAAGDALLAEGRSEEASAQYQSALSAPIGAPRTPWLKFARVAALLNSARSADALAALVELEGRLPGDPRVAFWRGRAAERANPPDVAEADRHYKEALTRDPRFLPASLQLARLLLDQRRGPDALGVLRRAEAQGAGASSLRIALGQALLASGNAVEAARTFKQALASDAKNSAAHLGLAAALEAQGHLEAARAELSSLAARGDVPGLGSRVAAILIKLGRRDEALSALEKEIAAGGATPAAKVAAARLAIELGRKDKARTLAQSAVEDDPRTPGALLILAEVWRIEGDLPRAILELRRALTVDGSAEVQLEFGRALVALGRDEEALSALSRAQDIPEAGIERGRVLLRRGDFEAATKELTAALTKLPGNAEGHLLLGLAEDRLGRVARAETAWKMAVRLQPAAPEARYRLGRLEMDRGRAVAALPHLRVAADHIRTAAGGKIAWHADLYFQLGFAENRLGARDRARSAFKRYLDVAPADAPARAEVARKIAEIAP